MAKSDENNSLVIEYKGTIYKCYRRPDSGSDFGEWGFLYEGGWYNVISYPIRSELNNLIYKYEHGMVKDARIEFFKTGKE